MADKAGVSFEVKLEGKRKSVTLNDLYRHFKPPVREANRDILLIWGKVQSSFSNRSKAKFKHGVKTGASPTVGSSVIVGAASHSHSVWGYVGTNDERAVIWLDEGTAVRYRNVSFNWRSKTVPFGGTSIRAGRGVATGFGENPGIEPRHFRLAIIDEIEDAFYRGVDGAWNGLAKFYQW